MHYLFFKSFIHFIYNFIILVGKTIILIDKKTIILIDKNILIDKTIILI
jgi:hypothetical protein